MNNKTIPFRHTHTQTHSNVAADADDGDGASLHRCPGGVKCIIVSDTKMNARAYHDIVAEERKGKREGEAGNVGKGRKEYGYKKNSQIFLQLCMWPLFSVSVMKSIQKFFIRNGLFFFFCFGERGREREEAICLWWGLC